MAKETVAGQHGGYRKPSKPAAVSGPGKFSQRTDGRPGAQPQRDMSGLAYGENESFNQMQASAPLADSSGIAAPPQGPPPGSQVTPMGAPTGRPDEPVTSGVDIGAGPGSEVMGHSIASMSDDMQKLKAYLPLLQTHLDNPNVPDSVRSLYRMIRDGI